jgi:NADH:ubiquinone oxidoreductase subunit 3 (subunit A)
MEALLAPPVAFLVYLVLVAVLNGVGRVLAGPGHPTPLKATPYASGEESSRISAAPGYRPFFAVALFFAVLHLGVLMLGSGGVTPVAGIYLVGLMLALLALILG